MESTAVPFRITHDMHASNGQRFANYIVDWIIMYILITIVLVAILLMTDDAYIDQTTGEPTLGISYFVAFLIMLVYYISMESLFARSVGKFVTKTKVITQIGEKPDTGTIVQRTFCRIIPFDQLSFLGAPGRGWHDSISRTYVVKSHVYDAALELHNSFEEIGTNAGQ